MLSEISTQAAIKHFNSADPIMAKLVKLSVESSHPIIIPTPIPSSQYFAAITKSIISQQISVKAASAVHSRVGELLGKITPENVLAVSHEELQACGLSGPKTKYIRHNAENWHKVPIQSFSKMSDSETVAELTKLYGIGQWTAEMFLMFSMARPDIFSYGDLALRQGLLTHYSLRLHWHRRISTTIDNWSPHKTIASLALWHNKDNKPLA